ncbi:response regulator [Marinomonas hwangdonensis]|uniref:Response regulator n=1 Tax=Marinomonas hwangdonensis TaxID=1053647 RepID=A0A3M8Q9I4_9GAMM|nr:response regulator [Marinomonas hwangdonensis]RNF52727.1 response regulator [Marinomonas hwangdonensis]
MQLSSILHVEDDESIRAIVEMALVDLHGFTLFSFSNGQEASEAVFELQPDLILLDAMMPGMDGLQTLLAIRKNVSCQSIPVVFMTARVQKSEKQQYFDAGAIEVIEKPFNASNLGNDLASIFEKHTKTISAQ